VYPAQDQQLREGWPSEAKDISRLNIGKETGKCQQLRFGVLEELSLGMRKEHHQSHILTSHINYCGERIFIYTYSTL
jgi:hypothetical protein